MMSPVCTVGEGWGEGLPRNHPQVAQRSPESITTPQENLADVADWMVKVSIGAIVGFSTGRAANGARSASHDER